MRRNSKSNSGRPTGTIAEMAVARERRTVLALEVLRCHRSAFLLERGDDLLRDAPAQAGAFLPAGLEG